MQTRCVVKALASSLALLMSCVWSAPASAQTDAAATKDQEASEQADAAKSEAASAEAADSKAQPSPEAVARAGSHFERGLQLYNDAEYRLALIEFERAYQLVPNYRVKYNIAQVSIQIGRYAHAVRALEAYLEEGGDKISEERKTQVQADLDMLAGRTARVLITSNVTGAEILLNDTVIAETPLTNKLLIDAGEHRLTVRRSGYQPHTEQLTVAGGDDLSLELNLTAVKKVNPVVLVREVQKDGQQPVGRDSRPREGGFSYATVGWIATGGLAVGAVVTGIVGLTAKDEADSLARPDPNQDPDDTDDLRSDLDEAKTKARNWFIASDVLKGAALVMGAASLYLTLSGGSDDDPTKEAAAKKPITVRAGAGLNHLWVEGRF